MDNKKICFIMCSNDEMLAGECLLYIEQLKVPDGFSVETLVVGDATSMTSGYNEAMNASDAKYKIYLHQDVLLINKNMLIEMIDLFEKHPEVGMLGMVGNTSLAPDCCPWSDGMHRRVGEIYGDLINSMTYSFFAKAVGEYQPVIVIDGLLMATQYDIPWREDLFTGWDFYDCSQALEFWKAGYQVAVPYMDKPWCLHDNDILNLETYDTWRKIFVEEYGEYCKGWKADDYSAVKKTGKGLNAGELNENKIAFVICYNNERYLGECNDYISALKVPDGMETDVISIAEADSMTAGYNAAMESSDAKYKVYLHQDVFIINENFIEEIVTTFKNNPGYGLVGVLGTKEMSIDGSYWDKWNVGMTVACNAGQTLCVGKPTAMLEEVIAVDGMIMITQYDVPWREDVFDGFDYYDISQCMEFAKAGHKVGVLAQSSAWCMHDCGLSKLGKYDYYRQLFCNEYARFGYRYVESKINLTTMTNAREAAEYYPKLRKIFEAGKIKEALDMINDLENAGRRDTNMRYLALIGKILLEEKASKVKKGFGAFGNIDDMKMLLTELKFFLWRLDYDKTVTGYEVLIEWLKETDNCASVAVKVIADRLAADKNKALCESYLYMH
ncbi:MAG: glycosyltransferase family protein [Lachnospiraceae bacterium]|nr:glycosyltransferase family protein [Lachnospiraceae bacterium]